jgi:hypothetical protein
VNRTSTQSLRIIVTGLIAQHPSLGGVAWDYVQYPLGLHQLGHDVYYFEDHGEWPYNLDGGPSGNDWIARDPTATVAHLARVMERFGLGDRWAYRFPIKPRWFGLPHAKRLDVLRTADLLINVSGTLKRPSDYRSVRRLAYIDSDPVFTQIKLSLPRGQLKFQRRVNAHDVYFSFGENLDAAMVPRTGHQWRPTRQPIVLSEWRRSQPRREVYTTVLSWTSYRPLRYRGQHYAQKDCEFRRFLGLPGRVAPARLEVAMSGIQHMRWQTTDLDALAEPGRVGGLGDMNPAEALTSLGWTVVDPTRVCGGLDDYRAYVESSKGEWSVAKNGYVRGQPGWFSCRSACYLAAGRPVVVQSTGFDRVLPVGEGLLAFATPEEAVSGIREVESNYDRHAQAARSIAEEYFDSKKVLTHLIETALN